MTAFFDSLRRQRLQWLPERGLGWFDVQADDEPYDEDYWRRYRAMDRTPVGAQLTAMRRDLVTEFWQGPLVDVGIGGGRFVTEHPGALGYDINPAAVRWLQSEGLWHDLYQGCRAASFWDSLEHMHRPDRALRAVECWAFVSLPIFDGPEHVLRSRHYRPTEHVWYFTDAGFRRLVGELGFEVALMDRREEAAGRDGIGSYALRRVAPAPGSVEESRPSSTRVPDVSGRHAAD